MVPPQVTKKETGSYKAVVSDGRGEDVSTLNLRDNGETRPCHQQTSLHKQSSPFVPVCISAGTFPSIMEVSRLMSFSFPPSYLITCPQYSATYL